ncbi:DUF6708 domain-containing protein [Massilia niastensis]|uniref:DUF6708 domain-containing protein n=1 Tax=Massilia niastensis TaxID=544911 RepID=UPI0012EC6A80|nr:DUF6708 domain-containing protein [Massilia niastensis]
MDFLGLIAKYRAGRVLSEQERGRHLEQRLRLNVEPHYQLSVIKMNSTYLETVDKWFGWKGLITAFAVIIFLMFTPTMGWGGIMWIVEAMGFGSSPLDKSVLLANGIGMVCVVAGINWAALWLLRKESFAYTHYPIRFNRKTRMVHVFRTDGTVLSTSWEKIFFTLGHMPQWDEWEVRGHVLEADNLTTQETFALSYVGMLNPQDTAVGAVHFSDQDFVRAHWEFIRRYMEDGPQAVSSQVQFCMPVDKCRESPRVSVERVFANIAGAPFILYWILFPFCLVVSLFRLIAMRTSKVPQWPEEVEASCVIDPGDPYGSTDLIGATPRQRAQLAQ